MLISWILLFSLLGSAGAIITAGTFLLFKKKVQKILIPCLIAYATGTLLATSLLGMIPNAIEKIPATYALGTVLIGIIFFFIIEKLVIWRHCHNINCEVHKKVTGPMILIGDAVHNFTDGIIIAASFLFSVPLGIAVGLSIIAHEIPQEVGDFGILLHSGYPKKKAFILNLLSSLSTLPGAILAYYALVTVEMAIPYVMAISAASFIYIALADLLPELHHKVTFRNSIRQFILMLFGIFTIILFLYLKP